MPVAGNLKLKCPRFPTAQVPHHDIASSKLIHLLNIIKADMMTIFVLFLLASFVLEYLVILKLKLK